MLWKDKNRNKTGAAVKNIKRQIQKGRYEEARCQIISRMIRDPDSPEPHNLLGILLEKEGEPVAAMKHFRAAWALDPSYEPARKNLESFAGEMTRHKWDYGEQVPGGAGAERKEEFKIA